MDVRRRGIGLLFRFLNAVCLMTSIFSAFLHLIIRKVTVLSDVNLCLSFESYRFPESCTK